MSVEDRRWDAVMRRDGTADGTFVYSVKSTGVYCRPSCPSRPAKRVNVRFHATAGDAAAAGFRPCLRCRPDDPSRAERQASTVAAACRAIREQESTSIASLAAAAGMSRHDLKELGEHLDTGQAGLVVVAISDMGAKVERAMKRAAKVQAKQLEADTAEIEHDAASAREGTN